MFSHGDGEAAHGEVALPGLGARGLGVLLRRLEGPADGSSLLWAEVQGHVLLALVLLARLCLLLLVVHGQDAGDRLAHDLDLGKLGGGAAGNLDRS